MLMTILVRSCYRGSGQSADMHLTPKRCDTVVNLLDRFIQLSVGWLVAAPAATIKTQRESLVGCSGLTAPRCWQSIVSRALAARLPLSTCSISSSSSRRRLVRISRQAAMQQQTTALSLARASSLPARHHEEADDPLASLGQLMNISDETSWCSPEMNAGAATERHSTAQRRQWR